MAPGAARSVPRILGLTGPIGCGKTTVGDILLQLDALDRIDADRVVHELEGPGTPVTTAIQREFGPEILAGDGSVDRARLARVVFEDPAALRRLESIVHPAVRYEIRRRIEALTDQEGVVVVDAVRLLQSDLLDMCGAVWVIRCSPAVQRRRLTRVRQMTEAEAAGRLAAQPSFEHPAVTRVIENSGSLVQLAEQVQEAWTALISPQSESL